MFKLSPHLLAMTAPHTAHWIIFTLVAAVLAALLVASVVVWWRTGKPTMTLLILGGGLCCLNESLVDLLGHCYFPLKGEPMGQTLLGRSVPIWVDLTYAIFFGAFPYFLSVALGRGFSRQRMWGAIIAFWVANSILELPLLSTHLYVYYGNQPFRVARFPLEWLTINVLGAFFAAVVAFRGRDFFTGRRQLLLLFVPFATYMASWVVDMPAFWAVNSHAATGIKYAGVGLGIVLGVLAIDGLIQIGTAGHRSRDNDAVPADRPATTTPAARELQAA